MIDDGGPARREIGFDIPTVDGHIAVVSAIDYSRLQGLSWRVGGNGYVYLVGGRKKGIQCLMHRIVMDAKPGEEIHHNLPTKLNNMRSNLERTTPSSHQEYHKHLVIERNKASRIYDEEANCIECGVRFVKDPNHRGRGICCSKKCGGRRAVSGRMKKFYARQGLR